ncbi:MAG: Phthiotriol/phenolphthiotriol dimycocerosates methyltransferase [Syntrophorhabdus sp. PtaU1.Bin002]|nr:MAG: Phthiotriol/phenolphthiotriol dimycocerosates methyltransferase [Syntrophorhabdus sp. PtaU1.Bin002]
MTSNNINDNMERYYAANAAHYDVGLMRIGCTENQAREYAAYFRTLRGVYYSKILRASKLLRSTGGPIRVLDIGCGLGEDIHALNGMLQPAEFVGVEVSSTAVQVCESAKLSNMHFFCGELKDLPLEAKSFDLILNFCVLEHTASPLALIQACEHLLKDTGIIVSCVPNHRYWWSWYLPQYAVMKLTGKRVESHSVYTRLMQNVFQQLNLNIVHYDIFGFRPPQEFFSKIPEPMLQTVLNNMSAIGKALHNTFFRYCLYLELYVCSKSPMVDMEASLDEAYMERSNAFFSLLSLPYFAVWWINVSLSVLKMVFKRFRG